MSKIMKPIKIKVTYEFTLQGEELKAVKFHRDDEYAYEKKPSIEKYCKDKAFESFNMWVQNIWDINKNHIKGEI